MYPSVYPQALVDKAMGVEGQAFATGQLRSYMRTPVGYYCAQLLSQSGTPCIVMGTGIHDWFVGSMHARACLAAGPLRLLGYRALPTQATWTRTGIWRTSARRATASWTCS
jgi:hypothetical protein